MRVRFGAAASLVLLLGCGASRKSPGREPNQDPPCTAVARHLVALGILDNGLAPSLAKAEVIAENPPESLHGAEAEFRNQCSRDAWSSQRRTCLRDARSQEDTLRCPER